MVLTVVTLVGDNGSSLAALLRRLDGVTKLGDGLFEARDRRHTRRKGRLKLTQGRLLVRIKLLAEIADDTLGKETLRLRLHSESGLLHVDILLRVNGAVRICENHVLV